MFMEEIAADENDLPQSRTGAGGGDTADPGGVENEKSRASRAEKGFKQG
jgi:hypothetical protein